MKVRDEYANKVKKEIEMIIGSNGTVLLHNVIKNNDMRLHGISIQMENERITPTMYIEDFVEHNPDCSVREIAKAIITELAKVRYRTPRLNPEEIVDLSKIMDKVCVRLINRKENKELLKEIPYKEFYDLAVILVIELSDEASIKVTSNLLSTWGISFNELYGIAKVNTERLHPYSIKDMSEIMAEIVGVPVEEVPSVGLHVVTNNRKTFGATCLLYDGLLEKIADMLEGNFVILPSSLHEVIVHSVMSGVSVEHLNEIVREVNNNEVPKEDVLSDHVYLYNRETGELEY